MVISISCDILYFLGKKNEIALTRVIKNEIQLDVKQTKAQKVHKVKKAKGLKGP